MRLGLVVLALFVASCGDSDGRTQVGESDGYEIPGSLLTIASGRDSYLALYSTADGAVEFQQLAVREGQVSAGPSEQIVGGDELFSDPSMREIEGGRWVIAGTTCLGSFTRLDGDSVKCAELATAIFEVVDGNKVNHIGDYAEIRQGTTALIGSVNDSTVVLEITSTLDNTWQSTFHELDLTTGELSDASWQPPALPLTPYAGFPAGVRMTCAYQGALWTLDQIYEADGTGEFFLRAGGSSTGKSVFDTRLDLEGEPQYLICNDDSPPTVVTMDNPSHVARAYPLDEAGRVAEAASQGWTGEVLNVALSPGGSLQLQTAPELTAEALAAAAAQGSATPPSRTQTLYVIAGSRWTGQTASLPADDRVWAAGSGRSYLTLSAGTARVNGYTL